MARMRRRDPAALTSAEERSQFAQNVRDTARRANVGVDPDGVVLSGPDMHLWAKVQRRAYREALKNRSRTRYNIDGSTSEFQRGWEISRTDGGFANAKGEFRRAGSRRGFNLLQRASPSAIAKVYGQPYVSAFDEESSPSKGSSPSKTSPNNSVPKDEKPPVSESIGGVRKPAVAEVPYDVSDPNRWKRTYWTDDKGNYDPEGEATYTKRLTERNEEILNATYGLGHYVGSSYRGRPGREVAAGVAREARAYLAQYNKEHGTSFTYTGGDIGDVQAHIERETQQLKEHQQGQGVQPVASQGVQPVASQGGDSSQAVSSSPTPGPSIVNTGVANVDSPAEPSPRDAPEEEEEERAAVLAGRTRRSRKRTRAALARKAHRGKGGPRARKPR